MTTETTMTTPVAEPAKVTQVRELLGDLQNQLSATDWMRVQVALKAGREAVGAKRVLRIAFGEAVEKAAKGE